MGEEGRGEWRAEETVKDGLSKRERNRKLCVGDSKALSARAPFYPPTGWG